MKLNILLESLDLKKFDPIVKDLDERWKKRAEEQLEALSNAVKTGVIYNVTYATIKSVLSSSMERSLDILDKSTEREVLRFAYEYDVAGSYLSFNSCAKQLRDIDRAKQGVVNADIKKYLEGRRKIVEAGFEIQKILKDLKPKIIKGRVPKPADPNAFVRKMGSAEAQKLVIDAVKPTVDKQLTEFEKVMKDYFEELIKTVENTKEITYKREKDRWSSKITNLSVNAQVYQIAQKFFEYDTDKPEKDSDKPYRLYNFKVTPAGKAWPKKESASIREAIEKQFLSKTVAKLSHIVEKKANLDKIEVLKSKPPRVNASMGTVEVGFKFLFTDGSHFEVNNKVVNKSNQLGTYFQQYPTTFHDVTYPDGTKMKTPSEEKMIKEFIKE
jgi:hypothetical protein